MKLLQRIGYYLGGFSIGLILLAFFLNGKKVSCSYGPEARVQKNINSKTLVYSEMTIKDIENKLIDTASINHVLRTGNVVITKESRNKPCGLYIIEGAIEERSLALTIENCDSIATVKEHVWK